MQLSASSSSGCSDGRSGAAESGRKPSKAEYCLPRSSRSWVPGPCPELQPQIQSRKRTGNQQVPPRAQRQLASLSLRVLQWRQKTPKGPERAERKMTALALVPLCVITHDLQVGLQELQIVSPTQRNHQRLPISLP